VGRDIIFTNGSTSPQTCVVTIAMINAVHVMLGCISEIIGG